eukprot:TRINITY_DN12488_c0_g1_i1.p1 TRINITY_DN12488_c0_g1~~TRINITY_DN12488_c0_g1_i1.p1  ORF type:complete len:240 (-),score=83.26 TRINITY_DN12488_c0_g1_i1:53-772(-)
MRSAITVAFALSAGLCGVAGDAPEATEASWEKDVMAPVKDGKYAFVKFMAPWCGHCKKLKPDWDRLAGKFNEKSNALFMDVDCTADSSKKLCEKFGVQGFPTLKYFGPGLSKDGEPYEEGRDFKSISKFAKQVSKPPCDLKSLENCDKKDKAYLEEIKDWAADKAEAEKEALQKALDDLTAEHKAAADLFEKQKEEAMATMKKQEELKKALSKLKGNSNYKIQILGSKAGESASVKKEL